MTPDPPHHGTARILVIDDHAADVEPVEEILKTEGYGHVTGVTGAESLPALHAEYGPNLIILNLWLPGFDGFAALEKLRRRLPEGTYLPMLVLSADATPETRRRALALGTRAFLIKPFDVFELLIRVANLLEARALYVELQRAHTENAPR